MDKKKVLRTAPCAFLAAMGILTILFFLDIKFVVGLNIIAWDIVAAAVWIFVKLCRWALRENTGRRTLAVAVIMLLGLFAAVTIILGLSMRGRLPCYVGQTEAQTRRTFVVEYTSSLPLRGRAKLYERFGPLLLACDVEEFDGEISLRYPEERRIYVSEDGKSIVVAYFYGPVFIVPLE